MESQTLRDGEIAYVQGSAARPYVLKNIGGVFSCSCPAWRNQSKPIESRTCKHLKRVRGEEVELDRIGEAADAPRTVKGKDAGEARPTPPVLLAQSFAAGEHDPTGWWLSEKLDGVRAYWDGARFLSRAGNVYHAPDWFVDGLGDEPLDGELWLGRRRFQETVGIVRRQDRSDHWRQVRYVVFDLPGDGGSFEDRIAALRTRFADAHHAQVDLLEHRACTGIEDLEASLRAIEAQGGEGLMLRQPGSIYVSGRSATLLKVKSFLDAEARVLGYVAGKGRHQGRTGALRAELRDGTAFAIGTGLSDADREDPPGVGTIVSFRYQELTADGVPRFPSYVGIRADVEWPEKAGKATPTGQPARRSARKPTAARPPAESTSSAPALRRFRFADGKSDKFWEVRQGEGAASHQLHIRYGRSGTDGRSQTKELADADAAAREADKLIAAKVKKGYRPEA